MKNLVSLVIFAAFAAMVIASCQNEAKETENGLKKEVVSYLPVDSTHVDLLDEDGNVVVKNYFAVYASLEAEVVKYADSDEAWRNSETLDKSVEETEVGKVTFKYNLGDNELQYSVRKVIYGKKALSIWKPSLSVKARSLRVNEDPRNGRYYAETTTVYELCYYGKVVMASATQPFVAEEGYVPAWVCNQWFARHNDFVREATRSGNSVTVKCNNTATFWQLFDDNSQRDSMDVDYTVSNKFNMTVPEMEVEDKSTLYNKSFAFTAETATVQGNNVKAEWQSAAIENNIYYNSVNYKDSIAPCVAYAKNLVFNADATAVTIYFFEKGGEDYATLTIPVNITQREKPVTLVKIDSTFIHNAFVSDATVSGNNIAVICNNTASFVKVWSNDKKDAKQDVKYVVTNNFSYTMPAYISSDAKGKTYSFNGSTATVEGKNVTVTFTNRVIADIMFNNKNYKSDKAVPQCEVAVKTVKFGESTAVITFTHENEKVTAEVPVTYNSLTGYERVGDPIHDSWNAAYGTSTGFGITCNNHLVVREVMLDGSKGSSFDLPYKSTNTWVVSGKTSFQVDNLSSVLNVREDIVNGSASVAGNVINFAHSMSAEKVSKGTFSYQPAACEAVAKYITVISATQARVDIYDDGTKVGEYILPVNITEKPHTFEARLNHMWCTMSLIDGPSGVATIDGVYLQGDITLKDGRSFAVAKKYGNMTNDGTITVTYDPEEAWDMVELNTEQLNRISNNHPLAWTGKTPKAKWGYIDLDEVHMISQGNYEITYYNLFTGNESRNVCVTGAAIDSKYPYPVVGTWKDGKITIAGRTLYINGSEN